MNRAAVARVFNAKGRPSYNPLIVHSRDLAAARALAANWPEQAERLASTYWPGPLTLVVQKSPIIPDEVTAGMNTVGLRVPNHPVAAALLASARDPIAAPSANPFTGLSPTTAAHVAKGLANRIDLILDGGPTGVGIESTVVDLSGDEPVLLRPGAIQQAEIERVLGRKLASPAVYTGAAPRPGPGLFDRHYSPRATLILVQTGNRSALDAAITRAREGNVKVALLARSASRITGVDRIVRMPSEAGSYAAALYAALHRLDDEGFAIVLVEAPPDEPDWAGISDRLSRAASTR